MNQEKPDPRNLALGRLSVREYSAAEMRAYLKRKGVSDQEARSTVQALVEEGLISDLRYARALTRDQTFKDKGPAYIHAALRRKGVQIDSRQVKEIYAEVSDRDELSAARAVVEKRYPRAFSDPKERQRAYAALVRRGFSPSVASRCLRHEPSCED